MGKGVSANVSMRVKARASARVCQYKVGADKGGGAANTSTDCVERRATSVFNLWCSAKRGD